MSYKTGIGGFVGAIEANYDGAGSALVAGSTSVVYVVAPYSGTITEWDVIADVSGSIVVDVWKTTFASAPPTVANTITGTDLPTLSSAQKASSVALTGWTTTITTGDVIAFKINSATSVTRVNVTLKVSRTA
jgi:hypothetical protein